MVLILSTVGFVSRIYSFRRLNFSGEKSCAWIVKTKKERIKRREMRFITKIVLPFKDKKSGLPASLKLIYSVNI
jgi:hypothetical protein